MAIFSFGNRNIPYKTEFAPFMHDLLLLQSSRYGFDFWSPVLENLKDHPPSSGRVVACQWFEKGLTEAQMTEDLNNFIKTLGLHSLHVVACGDAVDIVGELEKLYPGRFDNTLFYPQSVPRPEDLSRSIREFSQI